MTEQKAEIAGLPSPHFGTHIYAEVSAERERAHAKHGRTSMESQPADAPMRLSILMEEVGEVAKEFNEGRHRGEGPDLAALRAELIQVAAMSSAWADRLGFAIAERECAEQGHDWHGWRSGARSFTGKRFRTCKRRFCNAEEVEPITSKFPATGPRNPPGMDTQR